MTDKEMEVIIRQKFGDLISVTWRVGDHLAVSRWKEPTCAMAIRLSNEDEPETVVQRIDNARDVFANGLEKLIAAGGDHRKAWADG